MTHIMTGNAKPPESKEGRRIAVVPVSWDLLEEALFPPGTIIRDATFNFMRMTVDFTVENVDLPLVSNYELPPVLTVETEAVRRRFRQ